MPRFWNIKKHLPFSHYPPHLQEAIVHPGCPSGILTLRSNRQPGSVSVSEAVAKMLLDMGVKYAFGISAGCIAPLWSVVLHQIEVLHFRHETERFSQPLSRTLQVDALP